MNRFQEKLKNVNFGQFVDRLDRILDQTRIFPKIGLHVNLKPLRCFNF